MSATHDDAYAAVLTAAADLPRLESALAAEQLGSALLGSVYAVAERGLEAALHAFVTGFLAGTARQRGAAARATRAVLSALVPGAARSPVRTGAATPRWLSQLGRVRLVGSWAYGDVYGDQTSYLATFAYQEPELGGGEHAVVVLVDHNIGIVKDLFVAQPAEVILAEVRRAAEDDDLVWLSEVEPARLRSQVSSYLEVTDGLSVLPEEGSLALDRALAGARLGTLPAGAPPARPAPPDPATLVESFLESAAAGPLPRDGAAGEAARYAVRLIVDFAQDAPDCDPLRWSPAVAGLFLLDWVHRRALLDDEDVAVLPPVLRAWVAWAAGQRGLPAAAVAATDEAITSMAPELARLHRTGERRSTAVGAVAELLTAGVDPGDEGQLRDWLATYPGPGREPGPESGNGSAPIPRPRPR